LACGPASFATPNPESDYIPVGNPNRLNSLECRSSKSITADYLISLEDGKPYKMLKPHLNKLGLTPESYRAKYGLPRNYPMVAPNYAKHRSGLAKAQGLGRLTPEGSGVE
jgi:predicted transcriptional regulator